MMQAPSHFVKTPLPKPTPSHFDDPAETRQPVSLENPAKTSPVSLSFKTPRRPSLTLDSSAA